MPEVEKFRAHQRMKTVFKSWANKYKEAKKQKNFELDHLEDLKCSQAFEFFTKKLKLKTMVAFIRNKYKY